MALNAALDDAARKIHRALRLGVDGRIARGHTLHALVRIRMAGGAGFLCLASWRIPQCLAFQHRQHAGIGEIISLHGLCIGPHKIKAGFARILRNGGQGHADHNNKAGKPIQLGCSQSALVSRPYYPSRQKPACRIL